MDERHVIDTGRQVGHQAADVLAARAVLLPCPGALHDRPRRALEQLDLAAGVELLAVPLDQLRLVIEGIDLAGRPRHEQLDDPLGLGPAVQAAVEVTPALDLIVGEQALNAQQMDRFIKKITDTLWVLKDKKIGVLGLAFKQNTDDVRTSPAIDLCQRLRKEGASLRVHDPKAMDKAKSLLKDVEYVDDMNAIGEDCDAIVIATEWPEFKGLDLERARKSMTHPILFDGRNLLDPRELEKAGFIYKSVGR